MAPVLLCPFLAHCLVHGPDTRWLIVQTKAGEPKFPRNDWRVANAKLTELNFIDFDAGENLTMASAAERVFATAELLDNVFWPLKSAQNGGRNAGTG